MRTVHGVVLALAWSVPAGAVWASTPPPCTPRPSPVGVVSLAPGGPLGRVVSFHASEISLREALDRFAAEAGLRLTYATETLPLDRSVCVSLDSASIREVLAALLQGAAVEPVAAGPDHVVLAPARVAAQPLAPITLDRIVVTGSAVGAAQKPLSVALSIVDGRELAEGSVGTLAQAVNGAVPGLWMWTQSPTSFLAQYGSVRGASSFGLSYPKIYVDGIEVANPLLITRLTPEAVDRIEVIRGPQGAALYGADAISGVTNIVLRQESADGGGRRASMRTGFALAASQFSPSPTLGQEHAFALRAGSNTRSAGLNVEVGSTGEFIPDAQARDVTASGTARVVGARVILTSSARLFNGRAGTPTSPLLPPLPQEQAAAATTSVSAIQAMQQHTVALNLKLQPVDWWTHAVVLGVDGYDLAGVPDERTPIPFAVDGALMAARGGADRGSARWSNVIRLGRGKGVSGEVTLLAEHSVLHQWTAPVTTVTAASRVLTTTTARVDTWRNNSGLGGQLNAALLDRMFLTGGLRVEWATGVAGVTTLPMLGATWVPGQGIVTVKLRGAYGKGIRWPQTTVRETFREWTPADLDNGSLAPEEQSGIEGGFDLVVARALTLQVTRFDQTAKGLIQRVGVRVDTVLPGGEVKHKIVYRPQNVGEIANRGWELQGSLRGGPLTIAGAFSLVDSRVLRVAGTYTGDLRMGDRMLEVPRRTMSLGAMWLSTHWSASVSAYRAENWIYYDRLTLAQLVAAGQRNFTGQTLRRYWLDYPGVTHLRATLRRDLPFGFSLALAGENLLDRQTGEPDNVTVLPGRTIVAALRREF